MNRETLDAILKFRTEVFAEASKRDEFTQRLLIGTTT